MEYVVVHNRFYDNKDHREEKVFNDITEAKFAWYKECVQVIEDKEKDISNYIWLYCSNDGETLEYASIYR